MIQLLEKDKVNPERIVVIGAKGFISSHLIIALEKLRLSILAVSSNQIDLTDEKSVEALKSILMPTDTVVFVSALTPDKGKDASTLVKNIKMVEHFLLALKQRPVRHLVYISSDAVYSDHDFYVRENSPCNPSSFHGVMHLTREVLFKTQCAEQKIPIAILRPSAIYGAQDTHGSYGPNRFLKTAHKDKMIALFGAGEEKRDHVYIADVVDIIQNCILRKAVGTLNVVSGHSISFMDIAKIIQKKLPEPVEIKTSGRTNPVVHKSFDILDLMTAFPDFKLTPIEEGISLTLSL